MRITEQEETMMQHVWDAATVVTSAGEPPAGHVWVTGYDGTQLAVTAVRTWGGRAGSWCVARIVPKATGWRITHAPTGLGVGDMGRAGPTLARLVACRGELEEKVEAMKKAE